MTDQATIIPRKSEGDERSYRSIVLPNGLQCLLISDPDTDKGAASMEVGVGHFSDPDHLPGLAHYLEHMLFLGTEKYPNQSDYTKFLTSHAGHSNAYTAMEGTNYYFDVAFDSLHEALDRFAAFFNCPLLEPTLAEREVNAVNSENSNNLLADSWRIFQLLKSTCNPEHPFSKFGTGNRETLWEGPRSNGVDVLAELKKFYTTYYSAHTMKLALLGRESLDVLEHWARVNFSGVPRRSEPQPTFLHNAFDAPSGFGRYFKVVPVKDVKLLNFLWACPPIQEHYRVKPYSLLSHLLGHEGKGSILQALKLRGWANSLSAGMTQNQTCLAIFGISIELTEEGTTHVTDIIILIYQYLAICSRMSTEEWELHYTEVAKVSEMNFRFKSKENPAAYVSSLTENMRKYPMEDILSGPWIFQSLDIALVQNALKTLLSTTNLRIVFAAQRFKGLATLKEKWYQTEYSVEDHPPQFLKALESGALEPVNCNSDLALPEPNEFIPSDFTIKIQGGLEDRQEFPVKVDLPDATHVTCWHKLDGDFLKPKGMITIQMHSTVCNDTAMASLLTSLFTRCLEDHLSEYSYNAEIAGLGYKLSQITTGMHLAIQGYNEKLPVLLHKILEMLRTSPNEARFAHIKEQLRQQLANYELEQPYQQGLYMHMIATEGGQWHFRETLRLLPEVTPSHLKRHIDNMFFVGFEVEMLVHGNFSRQDAVAIGNMVGDAVRGRSGAPVARPEIRIVQLSSGVLYAMSEEVNNPQEANAAITAVYQLGPESQGKDMRVKTELLSQILREPLFDELRTVEQLGYLVHGAGFMQKGVLNMRFIIQSSDHPADYLHERCQSFLHHDFRELLEKMNSEEFEKQKASLIHLKLEKDKNLQRQSARYWGEIQERKYIFNRAELEVAALRSVSQRDLLDFFDTYLLHSPQRRLFLVQAFGAKAPRVSRTVLLEQQQQQMIQQLVQQQQQEQQQYQETKSKEKEDTQKEEDEDDTNNDKKETTDNPQKPITDPKQPPSSSVKQKVLRKPPVDAAEVVLLRASDFAKFRRQMPLYASL